MNEKFQKLQEKLSADEQLTAKLLAQETAEGAQAVLKEAGLEFSNAEIMELFNAMTKTELSEEELEGVAGGFSFGFPGWGFGRPGGGIGGPVIGPGWGFGGPGIGGPGGRPFRPTW